MGIAKAMLFAVAAILAAVIIGLIALPKPTCELIADGKHDFWGREVSLPSVKPQRIVSLSPANTEILYALGAGDRVVGVTSFSDYPPEAAQKCNIGPYNDPDVEKIVSLKPDVVFAMGKIQARHIRILERAGIQVVVIDPSTLQEVITAIDVVSTAIGEENKGMALHEKLAGQLEKVRSSSNGYRPQRVFLEVWDDPLLTVGGKSFVNDIITQAGGINVAAGKETDYLPCDLETLYAYNPDIYIVVGHNKNTENLLAHRPEFAELTAVKNGKIFKANEDFLLRPGPRCFQGLVELAAIIRPVARHQ